MLLCFSYCYAQVHLCLSTMYVCECVFPNFPPAFQSFFFFFSIVCQLFSVFLSLSTEHYCRVCVIDCVSVAVAAAVAAVRCLEVNWWKEWEKVGCWLGEGEKEKITPVWSNVYISIIITNSSSSSNSRCVVWIYLNSYILFSSSNSVSLIKL